MLYKIVADKDCFELNPELYAIPEFGKLTDKQFRVVALVADRRSPLRTLPERQRREKACLIAGYLMDGTRLAKNARDVVARQVESIERAIIKYREYQFDEQQDSYDSTVSLIRTNRDFINQVNGKKEEEKKDKQYGKDLELANKFAKQLPELEEARIKLETLLQLPIEQKPEITTFSSYDLPEENFSAEGDDLNAIEKFHKLNQKKE